jgi:transposase InsO family protein
LRTRVDLQLEVMALRHQLEVLRNGHRTRARLTRLDRAFWVLLYRLWAGCLDRVVIVKPGTVVGWHRLGFRAFWSWKSRPRGRGRPSVPAEIKTLIRRIGRDNVLWGAPRIHGELLKLGIEISQAAVSKYMMRHPRLPSQTWRTFLQNHLGCLASIDFFVVPTATFRLLFVFIVLQHQRRRILHFGVTTNPTSEWTSQQIREAFPWNTAPRYLIHDRDASYGGVFRSRLKAIGIVEVLSAPRSPWQNAYVERVIGSIRRECLNHVIVLNKQHLRQLLSSYLGYYHQSRTHLSLGKDCPEPRPLQPPDRGKVIAFPQVGGLYHRYERRAA